MLQVTEQSLASVPGIILRSTLRTLARIILLLTALTAILTAGFLLLSILLMTWRSPRTHKTTAVVNVAISLAQLYREFRP